MVVWFSVWWSTQSFPCTRARHRLGGQEVPPAELWRWAEGKGKAAFDMELSRGGVRHCFPSHTPRVSLYGSPLPPQTRATASPAQQSHHRDAVCNPVQPKISKSFPKQEWCVPHPLQEIHPTTGTDPELKFPPLAINH